MKIAIIGTGRMAQQHLACLTTLPAVKVAAVVDVAQGVAEKTARQFHVLGAFRTLTTKGTNQETCRYGVVRCLHALPEIDPLPEFS